MRYIARKVNRVVETLLPAAAIMFGKQRVVNNSLIETNTFDWSKPSFHEEALNLLYQRRHQLQSQYFT